MKTYSFSGRVSVAGEIELEKLKDFLYEFVILDLDEQLEEGSSVEDIVVEWDSLTLLEEEEEEKTIS